MSPQSAVMQWQLDETCFFSLRPLSSRGQSPATKQKKITIIIRWQLNRKISVRFNIVPCCSSRRYPFWLFSVIHLADRVPPSVLIWSPYEDFGHIFSSVCSGPLRAIKKSLLSTQRNCSTAVPMLNRTEANYMFLKGIPFSPQKH